MPDDYPEGDMVTEALFRVALRKMVRKEWRGAMTLLEACASVQGQRDAVYLRRDASHYFQARALSRPATSPARSGRSPT